MLKLSVFDGFINKIRLAHFEYSSNAIILFCRVLSFGTI